jgi:ABC-type nickel/cobalt efflux system permease component RcnA
MIPELLLVGSVVAVGVLHTVVPDHWVPITLIARQRGWTRRETANAALKAGTGHVLSTLVIALVVWFAGVVFAQRFGQLIDTASSVALIGFGGWIAISSLRDMRASGGHGHAHGHAHSHAGLAGDDGIHGPELEVIKTGGHGEISLSIFEDGVPPRFRLPARMKM